MDIDLLKINNCSEITNRLCKVYKSPVMRELLENIIKIKSEKSIFFIYGEKGTEKTYLIKIILEKYPDAKIVKINDKTKKKILYFRQENIIYIAEQFENSNLSFILNPDCRFKLAIFTSDFDCGFLYKEGKINREIYETLSKAIKVYIPPLRERKQDIIPLANFFLQEISEFFGLPPKELSKETKNFILEFPWDGNAYQLKHCLAKACFQSRHQKINPKDLFGEYDDKFSIKSFLEQKIGCLLKDFENIKNSNLYETVIQEVEKALLILALNETGGNQLRAAKILGINRNTLNKKLKHYSLI